MNDMSGTIIAKSDQINAADLIGTALTVSIKEVRIKDGEEQPVTIMLAGMDKGYRPCKGVRRLLIRVWGADASKYIGQSMTLFCDPTVTWAGKQEGGIRISHMTGLDEQIVEYMRYCRAATKPYKILPLAIEKPKVEDRARGWADLFLRNVTEAQDAETLDKLEQAKRLIEVKTARPELYTECMHALGMRREALAMQIEGKPDADMGEGFASDTETGEF